VVLAGAHGAHGVEGENEPLKAGIPATDSILPKSLEPFRTELGIAHGVRDVSMPEILLDRSRVVPFVRKLVAGRVAQHVRMDREGQFRELAGARN